MSQGNINKLLELWDQSLANHGGFSPFTSYKHIHETIDAIEEGTLTLDEVYPGRKCTYLLNVAGDAPWQCFKTRPSDDMEENAPSWKQQEYEIWFRDPAVVVQNILANPDFDNEFDPAPYVEIDRDGQRRWADFMSANYVWRQCVSLIIQSSPSVLSYDTGYDICGGSCQQ
jgi:hypothetical protein